MQRLADYVLSAKGTYDGSGFDGGIAESQSRLGAFLDKAREVGQKVKSVLGDALVGIADGITSAIGGIGAGIAALAAAGGIGRALAIEQARYKLGQMGLDVESIMASALQAVKGTKFGLDAAATSATLLGTSGVEAGSSMTRALETAAGIATISGDRMEDIADIMAKVASNGKLTGEHLLSFSARGINALDALSKHLGIAQADVRELVTKGEIDFETFADAMHATFGTAAASANDTFQGAWDNVRAALSRMGLAFADPALDGLRRIFVALIPVIDSLSAALAPVGEAFSSFVEDAVPKAVGWLGRMGDMLDGLGEGGLANLSAGAKAAAAAIGILTVSSLGGLISQIPIVGGALGGLFGMLGKLATPVGTLVKSIAGIQGAIGPAIASMSGPMVAGLAAAAAGVVALAAAFVHLMVTDEDFRGTVMGLVGDIGTALSPCLDAAKALLGSLGEAFGAVEHVVRGVVPAVLGLVAAFAPLVSTIIAGIVPIASDAISALAGLAVALGDMLVPAIDAVTSLVSSAMPQIQGIVESVLGAIGAVFMAVLPHIQDIFYTTMDLLQAVVQTVWPVIEEIITQALAIIQALIDVVTAAIAGDWDGVWNGILTVIGTVWEGIGSIVGTALASLQENLDSVLAAIGGVWDACWNAVATLFSSVWDGILSVGQSAWGSITSSVSSLASKAGERFESMRSSVTSAVSDMWERTKRSFSDGADRILSTVGGIPGTIMGFFSDAGSWLIDAGRSIIDGLVSGIQSAIGGAVSAVSGAVGAIRDLFPFSPAKEGPFSGRGWVLYSGMSIMDALAEGAESKSGRAVDAYSSIAVKLRESLDMDGILGWAGWGDRQIAWDTYGNVRADAAGQAPLDRYAAVNVYIDGAIVNDDEQIRNDVKDLLVDLADRYAMGEER